MKCLSNASKRYIAYGIGIAFALFLLWFMCWYEPGTSGRAEQYNNNVKAGLQQTKDSLDRCQEHVGAGTETVERIGQGIDRSENAVGRIEAAGNSAERAVDNAETGNSNAQNAISSCIGLIERCEGILSKYAD